MDLWTTTDSGVEEPAPLSKEVLQEHTRLQREFQTAAHRMAGAGRKATKAVRDAEEVARANLFAFERRHGLTSSDPRIG